MIDGVTYVNDGDWVESCTAAVELSDGRIEIVDWAELRGGSRLARRAPGAGPRPLRGEPVANPLLGARPGGRRSEVRMRRAGWKAAGFTAACVAVLAALAGCGRFGAPRHNVLIFVADGLRYASVNRG